MGGLQLLVGRLVLLPELQICRTTGTKQYYDAANHLADSFAETILYIGPSLRVADFQRHPSHLVLRQPPPQPPDPPHEGPQKGQCSDAGDGNLDNR